MNTFVKTFFTSMRKLYTNKGFLFLLNGFLLASLFYFYSEDNYEKQLFKAIAKNVKDSLSPSASITEDSLLIKSLNLSHRLLKGRSPIFENANIKGFKGSLFQPVTVDLMTGKGGCGSNSYVLGRLLQEFGMDVRFPQMKAYGIYGGHILLEVKSSDGWKVFDALYNLAFRRPDGKLASFKDVQTNWAYYKQQVPKGYDMSYAYEDARYTNWNKIPILMPLIKNLSYLLLGKEKTDNYSLRSFFLKKYNIALNIISVLYLSLCIYMLILFTRKKKQQPTTIRKEEH